MEIDCTIKCKNNVFLKGILTASCNINHSEMQRVYPNKLYGTIPISNVPIIFYIINNGRKTPSNTKSTYVITE